MEFIISMATRLIVLKDVIFLMDSWHMIRILISAILERGFYVFGQARQDIALYNPAVQTGKRRRPAKFGKKYIPEKVEELEETVEQLMLYEKSQTMHYRSVRCLARFLKGRMVRVVWGQFEDGAGGMRTSRLLLSTNPGMSGREVLLAYGKR